MSVIIGDYKALEQSVSIYRRGVELLESNAENAFECFLDAAGKGNAQAQVMVASMLREGNGVKRDSTLAIKYCRSAAELGNASGQLMLGQFLYFGDGVEKDLLEACKWFILASANKNQEAIKAVDVLSKEITPENFELARQVAKNEMRVVFCNQAMQMSNPIEMLCSNLEAGVITPGDFTDACTKHVKEEVSGGNSDAVFLQQRIDDYWAIVENNTNELLSE